MPDFTSAVITDAPAPPRRRRPPPCPPIAPQPPPGEWLTLGQASDRYGIDRGALAEAIRRGTLPAHKRTPLRTAPYLVQPHQVAEYLARKSVHGIRLGRPPILGRHRLN